MRPESREIPHEFPAEYVPIVRQVTFEICGADVEVCERAERWVHAPGSLGTDLCFRVGRQRINKRLPNGSPMSWGLQSRLGRIIRADGRAVMLAVDHGYFMGPTRRLEKPRETIAPLLPYTDSIMITRGVLRTCVDPKADVP